MAFSLSGSTITQSGTDTDLSGLIALSSQGTAIEFLTPNDTRVFGTTATLNNFSTNDAIVVIEFTTGADVTTNQVIWESGATGVGTALVVSNGMLETYAGNTNDLYNSTPILPNTSYSAAIAYLLAADDIILYLKDGGQVATIDDQVSNVAFTQSDWCGSDTTGVGAGTSNNVRGGKTGTFQGSIDSDLRVYVTSDMTDTYQTVESAGGVVIETHGSGQAVHSTYFVGNVKLLVTGTLTIDPTNEMLVFGSGSPNQTLEVGASGVLNLGVQRTVNGHTFETSGTAVIIPNASLAACCSGESMDVFGTLNQFGATISCAACIRWDVNSKINIINGHIEATRGSLWRIRQFSESLNIDGITLNGDVSIDFFRSAIKFNRYSPAASSRAAEAVSARATGTNDPYVFEGYRSQGVALDFSVWDGAEVQFNNLDLGANDPIMRINQSSIGLVQVFKEFNLRMTTADGSPSTGAKSYIREVDNGNRFNRMPESRTDYDFIPVRDYIGLANTNGEIETQRILTRVGYSLTTNRLAEWDYRTESNSPDDALTVSMIGYDRIITSTVQRFRGAESLDLDWTLFEDLDITESNKSIVDAYTSIDNANRFYDRAKSFLVNNWGTYLELLVTRTEDTIDLGDFNVTIDPNASQAFDLLGSTITIKANVFDGSITTTGLITLLNDADITGIRTDVNGTVLPPTALTVQVNQTGCDVVILEAGTKNVLASIDENPSNDFSWTYLGNQNVDVGVIKQGFIVQYIYDFPLVGENVNLPVILLPDRNYS